MKKCEVREALRVRVQQQQQQQQQQQKQHQETRYLPAALAGAINSMVTYQVRTQQQFVPHQW